MFGRSIRIIVLSSLALLVIVNLVFFTITNSAALNNNWVFIEVLNPNVSSHYEYRGFKYFFDYISTFPGLANSMNALNMALNLLSSQYDLTGINALNAILGLFWLLISPVTLFVTFVLDIINNVIWVFGFFIPNMH